MSSKGVIYIGPTTQNPAIDTEVWTDGPTHALLVKVVNPGGGGGSGTEFFEDTPHVSGDAGNMPLAVRKDTPGSLVSTDGDYAPLQVDASGALRVTMTGGGGGGGTEFAEDSPHASGALGTLALVVRNDTPGALAGTDLDYAPLQVDATGRLRVAVDASVALSVAVSNFPATQAVTQSTSPWVVSIGSGATDLGKAEDSIHASGDVGVMSLAVRSDVASGIAENGDYHPLLVDALGRLHVNVGDVTPGSAATNLGKRSDDGYASAHVGVMSLALRVGDSKYRPLLLDNSEQLFTTAVVTDLVPGTGATKLGKAEDAVHASGDVGVMSLAVRSDTAAATGANGDYVPLLTDSLGRLHVNVGKVTPGTGATDLGKAHTGAFNFGDVGVMMMAVDSGTLTYVPLLSSGNAVFVNVQGVTPGVAAGNLGKAEDAVHTTGDVGVMSLAVRNDAGTALAGTTGDYIPLTTNSQGKLWTAATQSGQWIISSGDGSGLTFDIYEETSSFPPRTVGGAPMYQCISAGGILPTNSTWSPGYISDTTGGILVDVQNTIAAAVVSVVPGTAATNLGKAEDAAHTSGDVGVMALAVRQDTLASSTSATGDYAALKVDSLGALYVNMGNPTSLADGQLPSSKGTLLTASGYTTVTSVDIFNTSTTLTETVKVHLKQSGGTSRQIRQYTLAPLESVNVLDGDTWNLENGDLIEGQTTTATTVDYFITGVVR